MPVFETLVALAVVLAETLYPLSVEHCENATERAQSEVFHGLQLITLPPLEPESFLVIVRLATAPLFASLFELLATVLGEKAR